MTTGAGYDPLADVQFTMEDQRQFAIIQMATMGIGISPAFGRAIGRPLREGVDEFFGPTVVLGQRGAYERMAEDMGAAFFKIDAK